MKIAIVGAGVSGCNLYFNLKEKYENITIFEKSRGTGGRLSTKYINFKEETKFIDHGAPFLVPHTDELKDFCLYLSSENILKNRYDTFLPKNGMNKICSFLIEKEDLVTQTRITKASYENKKWILEDENQNKYDDFDILLLTIPAIQILEMDIKLEEEIKSQLQEVKYDSVFTLILHSNDEIKLNENILYENEIVKDVIDNSKKYYYKDFSSYVIHSSSEFANQNNNKSKEEIFEIFKENINDKSLNEISVFKTVPHLWKYGFAKTSLDIPYYFDENCKLGICGDYFHLNNVEGSYLSSSILADKLM